MQRDEVKISKQAKYKRMDALHWGFSPFGVVRLRRPDDLYKPNAIALEDLPPGGVVVLDVSGGLAEVRAKK